MCFLYRGIFQPRYDEQDDHVALSRKKEKINITDLLHQLFYMRLDTPGLQHVHFVLFLELQLKDILISMDLGGNVAYLVLYFSFPVVRAQYTELYKTP